MNLLQIQAGSVIFGHPPLLDHVDLSIEPNERVCIVGRNGSGKSTLMQVISGDIKLDDGRRTVQNNIRIARLEQDPPEQLDMPLFNYVAQGLEDVGKLLQDYHKITQLVADDPSEANLNKMMHLQEGLDANNAWEFEHAINSTLTLLKLDADVVLSSLSGGWRRKAALARALVSKPDILLLDEPTNHLDIDMVKWLENTLKQFSGTIVFISHDRTFICNTATRIVDLDRGRLKSYPGNYEKYLAQKAHDLAVEQEQNALFDKKLAQEEVWIRQGIKARRTRNEGRVRALKALRDTYQSRRNVQGSARIQSQSSIPSGKRVVELTDVSYGFSDKMICRNVNLSITRGDKIAFIGPNGCGKSTLIKLVLGQLEAQSGEIKTGVNLEVAYFDQHRDALDLDQTVADCAGDGKQDVMVHGKPRHIISYLQDYLFAPDRINAPVRALSGGEKNRLLLAKLMLKPSNVLVLDEPTNDLDVETLELLESLLVDYQGTVILVSHDREFIDNVVTSCVVFEGDGVISEFVGGYSVAAQWYEARQKQQNKDTNQGSNGTKAVVESPNPQTKSVTKKTNKLSYKDNKELSELPLLMEKLEGELAELQEKVNQPDFFSQEASATQPILDAIAACEAKLEKGFARWDELELKQQELQR